MCGARVYWTHPYLVAVPIQCCKKPSPDNGAIQGITPKNDRLLMKTRGVNVRPCTKQAAHREWWGKMTGTEAWRATSGREGHNSEDTATQWEFRQRVTETWPRIQVYPTQTSEPGRRGQVGVLARRPQGRTKGTPLNVDTEALNRTNGSSFLAPSPPWFFSYLNDKSKGGTALVSHYYTSTKLTLKLKR